MKTEAQLTASLAWDMERLKLRTPKPMSDSRKVLVALEKSGTTGLTGLQLGKIVPRYSTRISDLRAEGWDIRHFRDGKTHRFVLGNLLEYERA